MLEKNSLTLGLLLGFLVPALGFGIFYGLYAGMETLGWVSSTGFRPMFRERTCGILAIALNAFLLNFFQKRYKQESVRGIVAMTMAWVFLWMILFGKHIF